mmetsp:Transcript_2413/g.4169  ORF Transcript_2413/g.4169 Transcript_2413/m.4169 type:complete len:153 (+) Transcript_2413:1126-1584(+)
MSSATAVMSVFADPVVSRMVRIIMWDGKKTIAQKIVAESLRSLRTDHRVERPVEFLKDSVERAKPLMECRKLSVAGRTMNIPTPCPPDRQESLALRFIRDAFRKRKGGMSSGRKLAMELVDLSKGTGEAKRRRDELHKQAEANKVYAYLGGT